MSKIRPPVLEDGTIADVLREVMAHVGSRADIEAEKNAETARARKKNYAQSLSDRLATRVAADLRPDFEGILPTPDGKGRESKARTSKGYKRLDVNYSTPQLGLGLGVSIKTINFKDQGSGRYTKNVTRVDNELRAEASDYHERQPYAVMAALVFVPGSACIDHLDAGKVSSFGHIAQTLKHRAGRSGATASATLFEKVYVGIYDENESAQSFGAVSFFDVENSPPKNGYPTARLTWREMLAGITAAYDARNSTNRLWEGGKAEPVIEEAVEDESVFDD